MAIFTLELLEEIILAEKNGTLGLDSDFCRDRRYVLIHINHGHFKYYVMDWDHTRNIVKVMWGRIGANPQSTIYDSDKAEMKLREKRRKGYEEVTPETYKSLFAKHGNLIV